MLSINKLVDKIIALEEGEHDVLLDANLSVSYTKEGNIFSQLAFDRRNNFDSYDLMADYVDVTEEDVEDVVRDAVYALSAAA